MEVGESSYALISSPYDSFMRKHLQHYGYFTGRSEAVKKYGFIPSKSQLTSSTSESESSSDDDDQATNVSSRRCLSVHRRSGNRLCMDEIDLTLLAEFKARSFVPDPRANLRQARVPFGLNFRGANDESSFEPRWPIEIEVLHEARIKHIDTMPKQPELFYKSTSDHMPFVRSYDENNGRAVFNYSPETCGYFIRSRIGGNREGCRPAAVAIRNAEDTTVIFESRFESGNLMKAVQVGEFEYELYLRYDLYTKRNTQWFYFRMQNIRANKRYRFSIVNFFKPTSLYSNGMKPLLYSTSDAETKNIGWRRWGEEIVYYRNNLPAPDNPSTNMYSLSWTCKFPNDNDTYYFAHCYPYTYSDLQDYLTEVQSNRFKSQYCKQKILCRTLAGNFIYMLTITSPTAVSIGTCSPEQQIKKGIVVTARVHPGETNASWMMKGLLDFLLGESADARILRDNFIFKIIPMLNPDGVIVGNYRCSLSGRDLNRNYKTILKDAYPSIWHTREMIKRFMNETELVLYCDFHGHSRKQNVFVYGCENKHLPNERFKERVFPAMLCKNDPTKFSFCSCKFKVQKHKEGTGRIVMWSMGIMNSYTLEATFCGSTQKDRAGHQFTTKDLESIGYHFLDSLLDYCDPDHTKHTRLLNELEDDLRRTIQMRLLSRGIQTGSLADIDLDQFSSEEDSSDDGGSDSSIDDGLPKHLEVIAAAKIRLKKARKKILPARAGKDTKRKDEIDKENLDKSKPVGVTLSKSRTGQLPSLLAELVKPSGPGTARRSNDINSDTNRPDGTNNRTNRWPTLPSANSPTSPTMRLTAAEERARRSQSDYFKLLNRDLALDNREKPERQQQQQKQPLSDDDIVLTSSYTLTPAQAVVGNTLEQEYTLRYASTPSNQVNVINDLGLVNEPRDAFTATYLLRRLNSLERESVTNTTNVSSTNYPMLTPGSRIDEDTTVQATTDGESDPNGSRTTTAGHGDSGRQLLGNYVTQRLSLHLQERLLGSSRSSSRPKSTCISVAQNRTILDIRSIQPPIQAMTAKRTEQQRQRILMVVGKQNCIESNERQSSATSRTLGTTPLERQNSDTPSIQESTTTATTTTTTTATKNFPIHPENVSLNLLSRYETMATATTTTTTTTLANPTSSLHKTQTIRASSVKKSSK